MINHWCYSVLDLSLMEAGAFIETIEKRQGLKVGCVEEVAFRKGFISRDQLEELAGPLTKSGYGEYLMRVGAGFKFLEEGTMALIKS
jgi:glucose-1-phosphate thymidylyltransferase